MKAPCHGCQNRKVGCHAACERYREYDLERQRIREEKSLKSEGRELGKERKWCQAGQNRKRGKGKGTWP